MSWRCILGWIVLVPVLALTKELSLREPTRRVDGLIGPITNFPYLVAIFSNFDIYCGGVIYNQTTILTAAQCFNNLTMGKAQVRAGSNYWYIGGSVHTPIMVQCHPLASPDDYPHNIAIVFIDPPIVYDRYRQPINITQREPVAGENVTVSGYGTRPKRGPIRGQIFVEEPWISIHGQIKVGYYTTEVMQKEKCDQFYVGLVEPQFCAWTHFGACHEDNGGPVVRDGELVGIMSHVQLDCGWTGQPHVCVSIAHKNIISWIRKSLA